MARIFNIYFSYLDIMHNAVISVRITPFFTEYTINNFNEELMELLPGNKIISRSPGSFIFKNTSSDHSKPLMNAIIMAVGEHLHATKV